MKKTISIILAILMIVGTMPFALAVEEEAGTDIIDATNMTADELEDAVNAALAAGYTAISVNLVEDAESDMFSAITAPLAADGIEEGSIDLTISGAKTVPDNGFFDDDNYFENGQKNIAGDKLKSLTLTDVETIGDDAFSACTYLESVTLTDATTIGKNAFVQCENMTYFSAPKAITIASEAFHYCYSLIKVNLPSARTIGLLAFSSCGALKEVSLPECTSIGDSAFLSCFEMETIYAPKVTIIGSYAFQGCESALKTLTLGAVTSVNHSRFGIFHENNENNMKKIDLFLSCEQKAMAYNSSTEYWTATGEAFDFGSTNKFIGYTFKSVTLAHTAEADDGDCTTAVKCANCDETAIEAKENHVSENPENKATCQKKAICDLCGTEYGDKDTLNHKDTLVQVDAKAPTCTEIGYDAYEYCKACDYTTYEEKEALDHDWSNKDGICERENCGYKCPHETITDSVCVACGGKYCGADKTKDKVVWFYDEATKTITISGSGAMANHFKLPWWSNYDSEIKKVVIENGVTSISEGAFSDCTALISVEIPDSLTTIANRAFLNCTELTTITIPKNVTTIGESAFEGCTKLTTITIPNNVTTISERAFCDCKSLEAIEIPDNITSIENGAFEGCTALKIITIPKNVKIIDQYAFYNCTALTSVTIGEGVTTIDAYAFLNCTALTTITFLKNVTTIVYCAFDNCNALSSVNVPCNWDGSIYFGEIKLNIAEHKPIKTATCISKAECSVCGEYGDFAPHTYENGKCTAANCNNACAHETITDGVCVACGGKHCGKTETDKVVWFYDASDDGNDETLPILTITGKGAMADFNATSAPWKSYQSNITTVVIGSGVTAIGNYAFSGCKALASVTIPESVTTIGAGAFYFCIKLISITIPESVTTISNSAFYSCTALTSIEVDVNNSTYLSDDNGVLFNKDKTELICYPVGKTATSYTIPDGVKSIGDIAFYDCTSLTTIEIPDSVTTIGEYAFNGCTALASVTIPDSVETIGSQAFSYCTSLTTVSAPCSWNEKPLYTFEDWVKVVIPKHTIENNNCTVCKGSKCGATESDTVTWVYDEGTLYINGTGAMVADYDGSNMPWYSYQDKITKIIIENGVTTIGMSAFSGCDNLTSVTIPKSVTTIGMAAFSGCGLTSVTIPESVTEIDDRAFIYCRSLTSVEIPESVTTIGESAFYGCSELTSVKIGNDETEIDDYAFDGCNKLSTVNVPCDWDTENPPYAFDESVLEKYHNIVTDEAKAPTCTATGLTEGKHCTRCDDKTVAQEVVPALNHKDTLVQVEAKAPTCEAIGWDAYEHCTECDYTTYKEKAKLGHDIVSHSAKSATCETIGWYAYDTCSRCDYTTYKEIAKLGHDKVSHSAKSATCEAIGWYAYDTCSRCDYTTYKEIAKLGHDIVIDKAVEATCTKTGLTEGSHCTRCNDKTVKQNVIPAKAHTEVTVTGKAATCTETGLTDGKKCSVCGTVTKAQETIAKKAHTEVTVTGKAATCTATGLTDGKKCSVCGTVTKAQETIKATGHTTSVINAKVATCTVDGYSGDTYCSTCKSTTVMGSVIKATGHKSTLVGATHATFKADGYTGDEVCSVCNQTLKNGAVIKKLTLTTPAVTAKNSAKGITISWNAIENAESYIVYRRVYDALTKKWSGWSKLKTDYTSTSFEDTTVTLGTQYRYTVRAVNGDVMSKYESTATIKYNVTPTVKVSNTANGIKVSWSTATNATGYRVYRSTLSNGKWSGWKNMGTAKANKTAWTDKTVKTGVTYKYTVRAVYNNTLSSYNKTGAAVLFLATPTVKIANASNGIKVSWSKVNGATGYVVYSSQYDAATQKWSGWSNRGTVNTNSWVDTAVKSGVQYKYTVRATNGKTLSAYKGTSGLMFLTQPTVKIANVAKGIKVTWSMCDGATGYTVYRSEYDAKTKKWSKWNSRGTAAATKSSWTDKKVTSGKYYKYTVRAVNGNVKSTYVSSGKLYYLLTPTVTATAVQNEIKVSWTQSAGAKGYTVYSSQYDPVTNKWSNWSNRGTAKADQSSWVDKKAQAGVKYRYTVRAVNNKVKSAYTASNEVTK